MLVVLLFWIPIAAIDPVLGVLVVGVVAPLGAYLAASHKMSGKIGTTEAHDLWEESRAIREWSAARIDKCDEEIHNLRTQLGDANAEISKLKAEVRRLEGLLREREEHHDF